MQKHMRRGMQKPLALAPRQPPQAPNHGRQQHPPLGAHGQPRVEVFGMKTNIPVVRTIAVLDGTSGQIVYQNDQGQGRSLTGINSEGFTDLILTGPHRAISGDGGSFAVKLDIPCSDESDDVDGATIWECNVVDDTDSVVESSIATDNGNIVVVTCAMLSNAVEATVHVSLAATTATHVYGKIIAHIPRFGDEDHVILFSREADERVELAPSPDSGSNIPVPLARSVVVMPIDSSLEIKVNLHATTIIAPVHDVAFGGNLVFSLGEHMLQIHTAFGELSIHVDVTQ